VGFGFFSFRLSGAISGSCPCFTNSNRASFIPSQTPPANAMLISSNTSIPRGRCSDPTMKPPIKQKSSCVRFFFGISFPPFGKSSDNSSKDSTRLLWNAFLEVKDVAVKNRLKDIRFEHKMNQTEFAEYLGVNRQLYNRWERQTSQPNAEWLLRIVKKIEKPLEEIIYEPEE
jgi:DNA-binding XRE family transcriptional regulator